MEQKTKILIGVALVAALGLSFYGGMKYKEYQIRTAIEDALSEFGEAMGELFGTEMESAAPAAEAPTIPKLDGDFSYVDWAIGDELELATMKFRVKSAGERQTMVGNSYYGTPVVAKAGAKFVLLEVDITNTTNAAFPFFARDGFMLVDDKGRQYTSYENSIGNVPNYIDVRTLAPGIRESGGMAYEIPADSESYALVVGKGGTNEIHRIRLK